MYKNLLIFAIVLIIIYVLILCLKTRLLYFPAPADFDKYQDFYHKLLHLTTEKSIINDTVRTPDNIELDTFYLANPSSPKCIIYFHGNAGNISNRYDMIKFLYNFSSVIIFDYRSYGKSTGNLINLSAASLNIDAETIWNYATMSLNIKPANISFLGESLGCAVAIALAAKLSKQLDDNFYPHAIILNSPFYSLKSMINDISVKLSVPYIGDFLSCIFGREYQSDELISYINYRISIIIAHSQSDEVIPYSQAQDLYEQLTLHPKSKFITISGTHNAPSFTNTYLYSIADLFNE